VGLPTSYRRAGSFCLDVSGLASARPFPQARSNVDTKRPSPPEEGSRASTRASTTELPSLDGPLHSSRRTYLLVHLPEGPHCVEIVEGGSVTVGRGSTADLVIDDAGVSRMHVRFARGSGLVRVNDLGSRNGTFVRGQRLSAPYLLAQGDVVSFGRFTASLVFEPPPGAGRLGVASYEQLLARATEEIERARSGPHKLCLALLGPDFPSEGQAELAAKLRSKLRPVDVIASLGEEALLVLLPGADASEGRSLLDRALLMLGEFRIGIAGFPEAAASAEALMSQAHAAYREAHDDQRVVFARREHDRDAADHEVVVQNPRMREVYALVARVARTPATALVFGETGTGKELIARALHAQSPRHAGPFCAINCATIPATLIESTLFGHEKGAFTGAQQQKKGLFEQAHGGTVFLDEVGELPPPAQAALLRVLEERMITRVGAVKEISVDVRVVAATHRDLEQMVADGSFRADLYHRLNTLSLSLPPLRERRDEIAPLARVFLRELCREWGRSDAELAPETVAALEAHSWPGNVRELRNVIERALILSSSDRLGPELLPESLASRVTSPPARDSGDVATLAGVSPEGEQERILEALRKTGGNQTRAAELLGMPRRTFVYKLRRYGIKKSFDRE
jgi:two-component system response regulator AtoC